MPAGDEVTLKIDFSTTVGKIIAVYRTGSTGGTLTVSNSCPDGAPIVNFTDSGLRAEVRAASVG